MASMLRLNTTGAAVSHLQRELVQAGFRLHEDGHFGHATEAAVRLFHKRHALLPGGIAGQVTLRALKPGKPPQAASGAPASPATRPAWSPLTEVIDYATGLADLVAKVGAAVLPWATKALYELEHPNVSRPIKSMTMSPAGKTWLYKHEAQIGVSNHLYWPGGASGVTLGAGYDMKDRGAATIRSDMLSLGLTPQAAEVASQGAGKVLATDAGAFAAKNHDTVVITPTQDTQLLDAVLPSYEALVKKYVTIDLLQHEFDALVSFAFNPGGKFSTVAQLIDAGDVAKAMATIKKRVYSGGKVFGGLVKRRNDEVNTYLYGKYERT